MKKMLLVLALLVLLPSPASATKLVTYSYSGETRAGAVEGIYVIDLNRAYALYLSERFQGR